MPAGRPVCCWGSAPQIKSKQTKIFANKTIKCCQPALGQIEQGTSIQKQMMRMSIATKEAKEAENHPRVWNQKGKWKPKEERKFVCQESEKKIARSLNLSRKAKPENSKKLKPQNPKNQPQS